MTRWPTCACRSVTAGPRAATTPHGSWPHTTRRSDAGARYGRKSLPQRPLARMATTTSPGPGTGSGKSSSATRRSPRKTSPRISPDSLTGRRASTPELAYPLYREVRMAQNAWSQPTRRELPVILIRGFGGLNVDEAKKVAYQGFNDGTVYPRKRGENYIYEGLVLRFLKSSYGYQDATNVVGYYANPITDQVQPDQLPPELHDIDPSFFSGRIVVDVGMARHLLRDVADPARTVWVFRYYDLDDRNIGVYGAALMRVIDFIGALARQKGATSPRKVNIIAHS